MSFPMQRSFINGRFVDAANGARFDNVNPATGEVLCEVEQAGSQEVDAAVAAASLAFREWAATPAVERRDIMMRAGALIRDRIDELARLETIDTGKPIFEALEYDVPSAWQCIEYFAGVAPTIRGDHFDLGGSYGFTRREPLGVCAGIGAWNYPLQIASWKSAPAIACGNTMVFKPAELTPLTASKLAEIYQEAGLPDGVFNVVQGDGRTGELMTRHPGVAKVSLTGEVATGKKVMEAAAGTVKNVTLELGGKSPLIVFADADMDNALSATLMANFYTQGEVCSNGTRVFVERSIHDEFVERMRLRTEKMRIGDPLDPATHVGALISREHMEKVLGYIDAGKAAGAEVIVGGGRPEDPALASGFYVLPTIFAGCEDEMSIVTDEIFGPVMAVLPFDAEDEVIARANNTEYGLAAGVFTKDLNRAYRVVAALQAGTCWINTYNDTPMELPFGGYKQSGVGRENSLAAIEHYTQLKSVFVEMGDIASPY